VKINDGGTAFPALDILMDRDPGGREYDAIGTKGMSLRDWFAGQAMSGAPHGTPIQVAEWAYMLADAMIAERAKETK
jgi:hypothetical protein